MVSEIEHIGQQFNPVALLDLNGLGEPQVLNVGAGEAERVASDGIDTERATGTIYAAAARDAARSVTAGAHRKGQTSLELEDRGQCPVIGDVTQPSRLLPG